MRMPTYEYECLKCKRVFEIRQRISEPALTVCDVCGGEVRRLLSAVPFILKGAGWYVTDYPSESRKQALRQARRQGDRQHYLRLRARRSAAAEVRLTTTGVPNPALSTRAALPALTAISNRLLEPT